MLHPPFPSLEAMLSAAAMSALEGRTVARVASQPWTPPSRIPPWSRSQFVQVETTTADGDTRRYIVKRIAPRRDLIMRLTGDQVCRERLVWQHGMLDELPPEVWSPVVASAVDGAGWALLMHDVADSLLTITQVHDGRRVPLEPSLAHFAIGAMAAFHARFWESPLLGDPALGLCSTSQLYMALTPATARHVASGGEPYVLQICEGWTHLERLVPGALARAIRDLQRDPRPLCDALARYPQTLVHADARADNLALRRGAHPHLVLLDWQWVGAHPPAIDLLWFLNGSLPLLPLTREAAIEHYRAELARRLGPRFDAAWWQPQLELTMLGQLVRSGWWLLSTLTAQDAPPTLQHEARTTLDWLCDHAPRGLQCL